LKEVDTREDHKSEVKEGQEHREARGHRPCVRKTERVLAGDTGEKVQRREERLNLKKNQKKKVESTKEKQKTQSQKKKENQTDNPKLKKKKQQETQGKTKRDKKSASPRSTQLAKRYANGGTFGTKRQKKLSKGIHWRKTKKHEKVGNRL